MKDINTEALKRIAESWDGCMYDSVGESIDIGKCLREQFAALSQPPANPCPLCDGHGTAPVWAGENKAQPPAAQKPEPCQSAEHMGKFACDNRHQCWEPCGELGHSLEHARVAPAILSQPPAVQVPEADMELTAWLFEFVRMYQGTMRNYFCDGKPVGKWIVERVMAKSEAPATVAASPSPAAVRVEEVQGWISVEDRLPPLETDVLVRCLRNDIEEGFDVAGIFHDEWMSFATECDTKGVVTHWMPLPPSPAAKKEGADE